MAETDGNERIDNTMRSVRKMRFLYPKEGKFPFDAVCMQIVTALEERAWKVPGISVSFHNYGSGDDKYRMVGDIRGEDFLLRFCRTQETLAEGRWNDIAGVTKIIIPEQDLGVYSDESGPTYCRYVGDDWERDREHFLKSSKIHSKLYGEPRKYLLYKGGCYCGNGGSYDHKRSRHTHTGRRPPLLIHDTDCGREYDLDEGDKETFDTETIFEEISEWLKANVLSRIEESPATGLQVTPPVPPRPFPEGIGTVFTFVDDTDFHRISKGKYDPSLLHSSDRYGLSNGGYRLLNLGVKNDGTFPEVAYDGFQWCGIGDVDTATAFNALRIPGSSGMHYRETYVIRIFPKSAYDIYIADNDAAEAKRGDLIALATGENRDCLTEEEAMEIKRTMARTLIPIDQYKGGYKDPVVLVNRELAFDEVEIVSGPHGER
jgi:hypothetical protein